MRRGNEAIDYIQVIGITTIIGSASIIAYVLVSM